MLLYNSQTRKKELFVPLDKKTVKIYVCGITPYDTTHLGHAFTYTIFDVLLRYLTYKGFKVQYVQNVTDIDDDILKKAKAVGRDWKELGTYWTNRFLSDMRSLNILSPTHYVKATGSIREIIEITKGLIAKGFAYENDGNVYFDHKKFKSYGALSKLTEKQMLLIARERGGNPDDSLRKHPLDFLLWQKSRPEDDLVQRQLSASGSKPLAESEPFWESPWGKGRPGWHIECSAMIHQYLGTQIDIHGGGRDLIFPHHESEIAQSESYTDKQPFVGYWMHIAMLLYEGEKMSKSLGNLVMVKDLLKKYSANAIRWMFLTHHYRVPWEFQEEELKQAEENIAAVRKALLLKTNDGRKNLYCTKKFEEYIEDDMHTPDALNTVKKIVKRITEENEVHLQKTLRGLVEILGFKF